MRLNEVTYDGAMPVDSYGPGFFRVAGQVHRGPMLLMPGELSAWGGWPDTAGPASAPVDVLLLGTGAEIALPPPGFIAALEAAGIAAEPMATPPACRTFNVLLSEGRRVGLAVLPV